MSKTVKIILIVVLVALGAWILWSFVSPGGGDEGIGAAVESSEGVAEERGVTIEEGRAILALLEELKHINLDETFFTSPVFASLQDWGVELIPEPKGRPDPFAPIGIDGTLPVVPDGE